MFFFGSMEVSRLPEEVKLMIFSLNSKFEDCRSMLQVCEEWRRVGSDRSIWKNRVLEFAEEVSLKEIFEVLDIFADAVLHVRFLLNPFSFEALEKLSHVIHGIIAKGIKLESFQISSGFGREGCVPMKEWFWRDLMLMCREIRSLEHLSLGLFRLDLPDVGVMRNCNLLSVGLRSVDFGGTEGMDDRDLKSMVLQCCHLEFVNLGSCPSVTDEGLEFLSSHLQGLKGFFVRDCKVSLGGFRKFFEKHSDLEAFGVIRTTHSLLDMLRVMRNVQNLQVFKHSWIGGLPPLLDVLWEKDIGGMGVEGKVCGKGELELGSGEGLDDFEKCFPQLHSLVLSRSEVDVVLKLIERCPNVEWLCVDMVEFSDKQLDFVVALCERLKVLCLDDVGFLTGDGWLDRLVSKRDQLECVVLNWIGDSNGLRRGCEKIVGKSGSAIVVLDYELLSLEDEVLCEGQEQVDWFFSMTTRTSLRALEKRSVAVPNVKASVVEYLKREVLRDESQEKQREIRIGLNIDFPVFPRKVRK